MKNYYMLSNGRIRRDSNTLVVEQGSGAKRPIPVEDIEALFVFGEVDLNSKVLNFLAQKHIPLHLFNYYGHYSGSFQPRDYLHSGFLIVHQVSHYSDTRKRVTLAREIVAGAAHSILRTLAYYARRKGGKSDSDPAGEIGDTGSAMEESAIAQATIGMGADEQAQHEAAVDAMLDLPAASDGSQFSETVPDDGVAPAIEAEEFEDDTISGIESRVGGLAKSASASGDINELRGFEGKMRERYYAAWQHILIGDWALRRRVRRPPDNELNALISFGNSWLYTICLGEIYRTQLIPTISYLHEPGERRFSLALDISELFKPLIVDRTIFRLVNNRQIEPAHFDKSMDSCFLSEAGKQLYLRELEAKLATTIRHRRLNRHVSYRQLIRLECYKLVRHLTGLETYRAFRAWW